MAWQSSPKPHSEEDGEKNYLYIAVLGSIGLLLEAVGFWLLFTWFSATERAVDDPQLLVGGILALTGFIVLTRWLAALVKTLIK